MTRGNDIRSRIELIMQKYGLNQAEFARQIGVRQPNLSAILKGDRTCGEGIVNKVALSFDINKDWLLTGEGNMLRANDQEKQVEQNQDESSRLIPFYDAETTGGYTGRVASSNVEAQLKGYIQPGGWFDGKETAAIRHVGDSMVEYPDGCVLAVREVNERRLLVPGRNYVIETDEYRVTKRVQRGSSANTIALYSSNEDKYDDGRLVHEPFEVALEDIRRIYSVLGYIVNQSGEYRLIKP